jgi:hypothetical protein
LDIREAFNLPEMSIEERTFLNSLKKEGRKPPETVGKRLVDIAPSTDSVAPVRPIPKNWEALRESLRQATGDPGAKARLAASFNVTRQAVNKWLSGAGAPSPDLTVQLLYEVVTGRLHERLKPKGPASASTLPGPTKPKGEDEKIKRKPSGSKK